MKPFFLVTLAALWLASGLASAETLTFKVRSFHQNQVDIAFYSKNRGNTSWPGGGKVWTIKDFAVHDYKLNCVAGEQICYGAWVRGADGTYWGTGHGGKRGCKSCCYTCNGGTTVVNNLNTR